MPDTLAKVGAIQVGQAMQAEMMRQVIAARVQAAQPRRVVPRWVRRVVLARMVREQAACGRLSPLTLGGLRVLAWWARR